MHPRLLATPLLLLLASCTASGPNEDDIRSLLAEYANRKGCATSTAFKSMPVQVSPASRGGIFGNDSEAIFEALTSAGLLEKSEQAYTLTQLGAASYDAQASGFCYTDNYLISDVVVVKEESENERPPALSGVWYVSFKMSPSNVSEWAKQPELIKAASRASIDDIVGARNFTVRMAKKHGEDKLILADPRFSFNPGIHFNIGGEFSNP